MVAIPVAFIIQWDDKHTGPVELSQYLLAFVTVPTIVTRFRDPAAGFVVGSLAVYTMGAAWLWLWIGGTPWEAVLLGVAPFVLGDALKVFAACRLHKRVCR